jgi:hypothetical protein
MAKKTLIYVSATDSSVFSSQVVALLTELVKTEYFERIVLLAGVKKGQSAEEVLQIGGGGIEVIPFRLFPNYHIFKLMQTREFRAVIKNVISGYTVIHLRGETYLAFVRNAIRYFDYKDIKILTDIRGANAEEIELYLKGIYHPLKYKAKLLNAQRLIKECSKYSDYISCVSDSLKSYVVEKAGVKSDRISVNHCLASREFSFSSAKRMEFREKLKINAGELVCVFVTGGNGYYQNTLEIVSAFLKLGVKVLNLSRQNIEGAINLFVPFDEVPGYLCAADIGIVWRNDDIVNNVASPVKFSEYTCCGLPVIANRGVHLINTYIEETGFGTLVNSFEEISLAEINELVSLDRMKISERARNQFSAPVIVKGYQSIYNKLIS